MKHKRKMSIRRSGHPAVVLIAAGVIGACTTYQPFDAEAELDNRLEEVLGAQHDVEAPFSIDEAVEADVGFRINPAWDEKRRRDALLDYIFGHIDLQYSLTPTRNALETHATGEGNCLSFVNLFVGVARSQRLNPFYVEVEDYQRWSYQDGVVVSRGHIVAGMYVDGELETFDFLPYRRKAYRKFNPIDDIVATSHYYNNLGAEALMAGDLATADLNLDLAVQLAPDFDKAINNYGVLKLRRGEIAEAVSIYERGLELHPDNVPIVGNLARALHQAGEPKRASALLDRLEEINAANPFIYIYRGDLALAEGDYESALDYMRRAYRADHEIPEVHLGLVRVYLALGKIKEARHHVERALKLDATHTEARKYAVMLQEEAAG